MACEMAGVPPEVSPNGRKMTGEMAGPPKFGDFLPIWPLPGHLRPFWDPPFSGATSQFAGRFSAILGSGRVSHLSVLQHQGHLDMRAEIPLCHGLSLSCLLGWLFLLCASM